MSKSNKLHALLDQVHEECVDDYVGLWSIVRDVSTALPNSTPTEIMSFTMALLDQLLCQRRVVAGDFAQDGTFHPWNLSTAEIIGKVKREWERLGRHPDIGEVAWFTVRQ